LLFDYNLGIYGIAVFDLRAELLTPTFRKGLKRRIPAAFTTGIPYIV
jgi:hypothetical protein